jgi:hypothetical protein
LKESKGDDYEAIGERDLKVLKMNVIEVHSWPNPFNLNITPPE